MTLREVPLSSEQRALLDDKACVRLPTPLLNSATARRYSITAAVLTLHHQQCRLATRGALEGLRDYQLDQRCLAELLIYYTMRDRLLSLLDTCVDDLLLYVIRLSVDGLDAWLADEVVRARNSALTIGARKAARDLLEGLEDGVS